MWHPLFNTTELTKIIARYLGAVEVAVVMAGVSTIARSDPFADDCRRLVVTLKSAFPAEVQFALNWLSPRRLGEISQQLGNDPKNLWVMLCMSRNRKGNNHRQRACRSGFRCSKVVVTKYYNPTYCECQFRVELARIVRQRQGRKKKDPIYYHCPCCETPGERKLQTMMAHAWRKHQFWPGCLHDFQLYQASGSMSSNMPRIQVPYDRQTVYLDPCASSLWDNDNVSNRIRTHVLRIVSSELIDLRFADDPDWDQARQDHINGDFKIT